MVFVVLAAVLAVALAQPYPIDESPKPYSFSYVVEGEEGSSSHSETADGSGTVRGSYTLKDIDGRNRIVEYVAGPEGFNVVIRTNEPGTDNFAPADVTIDSSAEGFKPLLLSTPVRASEARPVVPSRQSGPGRFALVPANDLLAREYYGQS